MMMMLKRINLLTLMAALLLTAVLMTACRDEATPEATPQPTAAIPTETVPEPTPTEATADAPTATPPQEATPQPTPEPPAPEPTAVPTETAPLLEGDFPLQITTDIATAVEAQEAGVPTLEEVIAGGIPYWTIIPPHIEYRFTEYALADAPGWIAIYPVRDYPTAAPVVEQLSQLLADKPPLPSGRSDESLPFLLPFRAPQIFTAQGEYVTFANGQGIRYLMQQNHGITPVYNGGLLYTFQGLTNDGAYYISAIMPLAAPGLPDNETADFTAVGNMSPAEYEAYLDDIIALLADTAPTAFTPPLPSLDRMMASLDLPPLMEDRSVLRVRRPLPYNDLRLGQVERIEGYAPEGVAQVEIRLIAGPATLATTTAVPDANGRWTTDLLIPTNIHGPAAVSVSGGGKTVSQPVNLALYFTQEQLAANPNAYTDRPVLLTRPDQGSHAVSGAAVLLGGQARSVIDDAITIGVLDQSCSRFQARFTLTVTGGSGSWRGILFLPNNIAALDSCILAYTGDLDEADWSGQMMYLPIRNPADAVGEIVAVVPDGNAPAGGALFLEGTAMGARQGIVLIELFRAPSDEEPLVSEEVQVSAFSYWQTDFPIPANYSGSATLRITIPGLDPEEFFFEQIVNIR
jgi:hypothetical protein